eukprot:TRINITY_DN1562_c0_g1_i5.p1 TRINITY_DN1562_c0_g1~~TRINITY_DN1562_c0_g1_i5.p1  ORF type:complete len:260 (-),score=91.35 TRINITY_DN1562_c0_g1_i5:195-974(-)
MSTAHRPTWKPAMGRAEHGRWTQVTSHDQGYTVMKKRSRKYDDRGREIGEEGKKLEVGAIANTTTATTDLEPVAKRRKAESFESTTQDEKVFTTTADVEEKAEGVESGEEPLAPIEKPIRGLGSKAESAIGDFEDSDVELEGSDSEDDDDEDDDEEDEEEEMRMLEEHLAQIRKEKEEEERKKQALEKERLERERKDAVLTGNPLLMGEEASEISVRQRWDEDIIFRNQARKEEAPKKRYVNDVIRNDFHRKFLERYIG